MGNESRSVLGVLWTPTHIRDNGSRGKCSPGDLATHTQLSQPGNEKASIGTWPVGPSPPAGVLFMEEAGEGWGRAGGNAAGTLKKTVEETKAGGSSPPSTLALPLRRRALPFQSCHTEGVGQGFSASHPPPTNMGVNFSSEWEHSCRA